MSLKHFLYKIVNINALLCALLCDLLSVDPEISAHVENKINNEK